ncbi:MAG TPA: ssl1498 family light-harvesting-like protein [Coleofasciculaceae cyanobacterium]
MYTTVNEDGVLNNYAPSTPIYYAEYPAVWEQQRYAVQGALATLFVGLLILTSLAVSSIG